MKSSIIKEDHFPILLCGDFNIYRNGTRYKEIIELLSNLNFSDCGPSNCITFPKKEYKIDYLFVRLPLNNKLSFIIEKSECIDCKVKI